MFVSAAIMPATASLTSNSVKLKPDVCSSCTPSRMPLTMSFTPPSACTQFWTSYGQPDWVVFLRDFLTHSERQPPQFVAQCAGCSFDESGNVSPGEYPSGSVAASTGMQGDLTTHYCCP